MRATPLLFSLCALTLIARAHAEEFQPFHVVATYGDRRELTCAVAQGDALWLGTTSAGMLRLQATETQSFAATSGLPGQRVRDCTLQAGVLWVATDAGLARWDESKGRFANQRLGRHLRLAAADSGIIASDGRGQLMRLLDSCWTVIASLDFVPSALALSRDGGRWAAGGPFGQVVVQGQALDVGTSVGHPEPVVSLAFSATALTVRTPDHALRVQDGRVQLMAAERIAPAPAPIVAETRWHGGRVIATAQGAFRLDDGTSSWRALPLGAELPCGDRISALIVHRGVLWVGSFDHGLCRRDDHGWTQVTGPGVLPSEMINALASDGTRLYVATARGLAVLQANGRFRSYVYSDCATHLERACPWAASVNGVTRDAKTGALWVADLRALHRIDARGWHHTGGDALGSLSLTSVAALGGEVAVGTADQGVLVRRMNGVEHLDDQSGLADNWVMDVAFDDAGRLWAATCTRGVSVREANGEFRSINQRSGLIDDYALSVTPIGDDVWVGTLSGVSIVRERVLQSLDTRDGLSGNEVHAAVALDGQVWLATDAGLSVLSRARAETVLSRGP